MRFSNYRHLERGLGAAAAFPKPLAVRFASIALAAVLAASFMPLAAFADEDESADPEGAQDQPAQTEQAQQGEQPASSEQPAAPGETADPEAAEPESPAGDPEADAPSAAGEGSEKEEESPEKEEDKELSTFGAITTITLEVGGFGAELSSPPETLDRHERDEWVLYGSAVSLTTSLTRTSARVTPLEEGEATVIHEYKLKGEKQARTDTFYINVAKADISGRVTLEPADVAVEYDGDAHTAGVATARDKFGDDDVKIEYSVDGESWTTDPSEISATDVSDSIEKISVRASVPGKYEGSVEGEQKLAIAKREVTVKGDGFDSVQPYTGDVYFKDTYEFDNVVAGQEATISYVLEGTEAGDYAGVFGEDFNVTAGGEDVTGNYDLVQKTPGTLSIVGSLSPGESITLKVGDSITLEGSPYLIDNWSVSEDGVIDLAPDGSSATVTAKAPGQEVTVTHRYGEDSSREETFTITVVKADISGRVTLEPADVTVEYDGDAHTAGVATATDRFGNDVKIEYSVDGESWTADPSEISATDVSDSIEKIYVRASVPGKYEGSVEGEQKLAIAKRQVTVAGEGFGGEQPYTGKEYSKTGCAFSNLVDGHEASISYVLEGTEPGTYEGAFGDDFEVMAGGEDVTANYELAGKVPGTLTIVKDDPAPVDPDNPDKPSSDTPSRADGKTTAAKATAAKPASKSAKTGDGIALYAAGICGAAIAAGAVAFAAHRKRNRCK